MKNIVIIDGIEYVLLKAYSGDGYVIVRSATAGVFAGTIRHEDGATITMNSCRRLWWWEGAASISQMAIDGVSLPEKCKFSVSGSGHGHGAGTANSCGHG